MRKTQILIVVGFLVTLSSCTILQTATRNNMNCPDAPKCVSSQVSNKNYFVEPFTFHDQPVIAMRRLKDALLNEKRVTIIEETPTYLRAEVRSLIFRFVDDVEFTLAADKGLIQIRSSARIGYSDFGVNRRRIERIRKLYENKKNQTVNP